MISLDWSAHKENCMFHKKLLQPSPDLPQDKFYVTVRTFHDTILDKGFAIEQASHFLLAALTRANSWLTPL
jgi:hypothetical protein